MAAAAAAATAAVEHPSLITVYQNTPRIFLNSVLRDQLDADTGTIELHIRGEVYEFQYHGRCQTRWMPGRQRVPVGRYTCASLEQGQTAGGEWRVTIHAEPELGRGRRRRRPTTRFDLAG